MERFVWVFGELVSRIVARPQILIHNHIPKAQPTGHDQGRQEHLNRWPETKFSWVDLGGSGVLAPMMMRDGSTYISLRRMLCQTVDERLGGIHCGSKIEDIVDVGHGCSFVARQ